VHDSMNQKHGTQEGNKGNSPKRFLSQEIDRARRATRIGGRLPPVHVWRRLVVEPEHERRKERAWRPRRSDAKLGTSSICWNGGNLCVYPVAEKICPSARFTGS